MVGFRQRRLLENLFNLLAVLGFLVFLARMIVTLLIFTENGFPSNHKLSFLQDSSSSSSSVGLSKGFVLYRWTCLCELTTLKQLFRSSLFPKYPDYANTVNHNLRYYSPNKSLGTRISGYLNVPESGFYAFQIKSIGMAEFWLKMDDNLGLQRIAKSKVIAQKSDKVFSIDLSNELYMEDDQFYKFEIFNVGEFIELSWILPGTHYFEDINNRFITHDTSSVSQEVPSELYPTAEYTLENENRVGPYYFVSFIPKWVINSAIAGCGNELMKREEMTSKMDDVNVVDLYDDIDGRKGDLWKHNIEVNAIVSSYMDGLERVYRLKYRTKRLYKMQKIANIGSYRYLYKMQLEFKVDGLDYTQRVIQYVGQPNSTCICQPTHLKWHRNTVINVIIVLKDQEKAIKRFIDRFEKVFEKTLEVDLHIIIVQFGQSAIDIQSHVDKTSLIKRYTVVNLGGAQYSKSRGLNEGVALSKGDHAIALTYDVNMDVPDTLFEDVRTSCIPGQVAFAPVFYQLECGQDPSSVNPRGHWCYQNYGIIAVYKTDWHKISGMELHQSEQKEMWNLIQKMQKAGMAVIRHTYPGLYRYYTPYKEYKRKVPKSSVLFKEGFLTRDEK